MIFCFLHRKKGFSMKFITFFSNTAILFFLLITVLFGIIEKKNILELFFEGVIEGEKIVIYTKDGKYASRA